MAEERRQANHVLVEAGLQLIYYKDISEEITQTLFKLTDDPATDVREFTHAVIRELQFRNEGQPKEILKRLRSLDKKLTGESFWARFSRFVLNTNWDEDYSVKGGQVKELSAPLRRVEKLVKEIAKEPTLLTEHLSQLVTAEGHRLVEIGRRLAIKSYSAEMVTQIVDGQLNADSLKNTQFIGGYFLGLREHNSEEWEERVNILLGSETTKDLGVAIVQWSGTSTSIALNLLEMYRKGEVKAFAFSQLAWNAKREGYSPEIVEKILDAQVASGNDEALVVAIDLTSHYFFNKEEPRSCSEELLFKLLAAPYFFRRDRNARVGYSWYSVAKGFRTRFPHRDLDLLSVILSQKEALSGLRQLTYPMQIADEIARAHPDDAWALVSRMLESDEENGWWVSIWLGDEFGFGKEEQHIGPITAFNPESVMKWVMKNPEDRAWKILRCLPKTLDEGRGGKLTRLFIDSFGDHELGDSLISHFWTGGWSGPESQYLARKRDKAREWISEIKSGKILAWLYRYIECLNKGIPEAELREEREF
jgi:hypothetical protein